MAPQMVDVAAAVIERPDGSFLLAQRPTGKIYEGYWEFPGGKVEPGESILNALHRELREELGSDVVFAYPRVTRLYDYHINAEFLPQFSMMRIQNRLARFDKQALSWQ